MPEYRAYFHFHHELSDFFTEPHTALSVHYGFDGKPSVKDAIEALGVPHTEVDAIVVNGASVGFGYHLADGDAVSVYPASFDPGLSSTVALRGKPRPLFVVDVNLGKLARLLRMLGFDAAYDQARHTLDVARLTVRTGNLAAVIAGHFAVADGRMKGRATLAVPLVQQKQVAALWPDRVTGVGAPLDWTAAHTWTFEPLDDEAFPSVGLAKRVGAAGGTYPAVFNAANEQAVAAFHAGAIGYLDIVETVERVVDAHEPAGELTRESLAEAEDWARAAADAAIAAGGARA